MLDAFLLFSPLRISAIDQEALADSGQILVGTLRPVYYSSLILNKVVLELEVERVHPLGAPLESSVCSGTHLIPVCTWE